MSEQSTTPSHPRKMISTTTVRFLRSRPPGATKAAGILLLAMLTGLVPSSPLSAQAPKRHWLHAGVMPPGAIGSQRLLRNGPLSGYIQPVEITLPKGVSVSAISGGGFTTPVAPSLKAGLLVGAVYRFRVDGVLNDERVEVYPTVEVIGRLYPPPGKKLKFPIPVQLTHEELRMAMAGSFITRVIYVENPDQALPLEEPLVDPKQGEQSPREQQWFEARPDQDPLIVADTLGRPVAILRLGSRMPGASGPNGQFTYCDPPIQLYDSAPMGSPPLIMRPEVRSLVPHDSSQPAEPMPTDTIITY